MPPATEIRKASSRRRKVLITVALAVASLCLFRAFSPSAPTVRFIRFDTDKDGKPEAIFRVTNPGFASMGILGYGPKEAQWCAEDTIIGAQTNFPYFCGVGMRFHTLWSREVPMPLLEKKSKARYGIYYDEPSRFYRAWRERFRAMRGRFGSSQIAWADGMPQ